MGGPGEVLTRVTSAPIPRLRDVAPELVGFDAVVSRALERAPEARWPTALALAGALEDVAPAIATHEDVAALVRAATGEPDVDESPTRWWPIAVGIALVGIVCGVWMGNSGLTPAASPSIATSAIGGSPPPPLPPSVSGSGSAH